nr:hypothetical protein [Tanacetum cinerariifolium]
MARTNVRRGGRSKRGPGGGGGRGLSDHEAARGWGQISIWTNTSCTRSEINETISSNTWVQKRAREPVGEDEPNTNVY